jgi:DNA mismatch repair ATPase MutL
VNLPKPFAVIRKVVGLRGSDIAEHGAHDDQEGEAEDDDEDEDEEDEDEEEMNDTPKRAKMEDRKGKGKQKEEDEEEPPLFAPNPDILPTTPQRSSSPFYPSSAMGDYSSELDMSSPVRGMGGEDEEDDEEAVEEQKRQNEEARKRTEAKRKRKERKAQEGKGRIRHYEVVGVVRKKVVFALRWVHCAHSARLR